MKPRPVTPSRHASRHLPTAVAVSTSRSNSSCYTRAVGLQHHTNATSSAPGTCWSSSSMLNSILEHTTACQAPAMAAYIRPTTCTLPCMRAGSGEGNKGHLPGCICPGTAHDAVAWARALSALIPRAEPINLHTHRACIRACKRMCMHCRQLACCSIAASETRADDQVDPQLVASPWPGPAARSRHLAVQPCTAWLADNTPPRTTLHQIYFIVSHHPHYPRYDWSSISIGSRKKEQRAHC